MDGTVASGVDEQLDPPLRLYERLRQLAGYTWDEEKEPFHSSYDNWQVFGYKNTGRKASAGGAVEPLKPGSEYTSSHQDSQSVNGSRKTVSESGSESNASHEDGTEPARVEVVARVSIHALREERAYHICKSLIKKVDPDGDHIIRPVDIVRLPSQQGDKGPIVVCIFESPGPNYLPRVIDCGPAWYRGRKVGDKHEAFRDEFVAKEVVPLQTFLDFAVGATECLEILHHGQRIVHGEIRGDAFHMNMINGKVRLINFGSGLRTFEHGLTSTGWSMLSKEVGAKTKLCYMSPEQTGRMPAEPDSRTDIYSLGILFWTLLTQQPAFNGETPMDIIQGVLGRRLSLVSSIRLDIPDVIGRIIQKMTAKIIGDRYHSVSGLRHDLVEVRKLLGAGDSAALKNWQIATKDVSSFFILPTVMIGRAPEHDEVVRVIDKVARRHLTSHAQDAYSLSSGSSISEGRLDQLDMGIGDGSSEGDAASSAEGRSNSLATSGLSGEVTKVRSGSSHTRSGAESLHNSFESQDSSRSGHRLLRPWEKNNSLSLDSRSVAETMNSENAVSRSSSDGAGSLIAKSNSQKFRRKGCCEVVAISGAAGLGKSCLVQSVQVEARRRGYFASSKFDQAKNTPFGPVLKLLSSLFKQVFSESNTDTPFHQILKQYVKPAWPMLHRALGLPEFLLGPMSTPQLGHSSQKSQQGYKRSLQAELGRDSSPSSSRGSLYSTAIASQSSQDFLRAGSSTKSLRLMNTVLDVLRVFAQHKFICLCLDDLQFADDESLDLITQIIAARMKMVIILTFRPDEILPERIKGIVEPPNSEEYIKGGGVGVTRITLSPLSEEDIKQYVAATLCRSKADIIPLAAVIQSKTAGNPFYMREMLASCHRNHCIYYDYKESGWCYDLDKIFTQFEAKSYHDTLNTAFITARLNELPAASRSILAWASLIGHSFSFELIQRLLSGEFDYDDSTPSMDISQPYSLSHSQQHAVEGLQAAIQNYIIVATQDDDRFRFAHDRYMQAATSLGECNAPKMHFIIAQTLMKYYSADERSQSANAAHICASIDIIKKRILHRQSFRKLLSDCAQSAAESGARPTAAKFYKACFALLQENPWTDGVPDAYYEETLHLHIRAAETYLYMGQYAEAKNLFSTVFARARSPVDKAPAWVLQSRVYAQEGDSPAAFQALKQCLNALDIRVDDDPSFSKCDKEFERLSLKIQSMEPEELVNRVMAKDSNFAAVGAVLVETISAAFWTDSLTFYQMALVMVNTQVELGSFPQAGMAYVHFAMIAITRFNMLQFASNMGNIALGLMDKWRDPYTLGRGGTIYSLFVGHIQANLQESLAQLEGALEYAIQAGDRISTILNFGLVGTLKFFGSENIGELEAFLHYGCEEVPNWQHDTRGGTMAIAIRQACRALQGRTSTNEPLEIMSDGSHNSLYYKSWLKSTTPNSIRPLIFYEGIEMAPLFLYGHYTRAIELGSACLEKISVIWSSRNTRFIMFMQGLSLASLAWSKLQNPLRAINHGPDPVAAGIDDDQPSEAELQKEVKNFLNQIKDLKKMIEDWQVINNVNYFAWSTLLDAQIAEMEGRHGQALRHYELSLDHAEAHGFLFEEALGNYLQAGFFLRARSRRAAKASLREATLLYRNLGAVGVAKHIENEHSLLLQGPTRTERNADAAAQTDFAGDSAPVQYATLEGNDDIEQQTRVSINESKCDRIGAWQGGSARDAAGSGLPALDMLDLTSILESSQVISSVLQVDQLLKTMCEIILQNCGGLATLAAIVVEDDDPIGWSIAASGDPERGAVAHIPGLPVTETALVAESVILYCTRFRDTVFVPDLIHDERFSNVTEAWAARNPVGKSVIALPICHGSKPLLGVLYLEGEPNVFTDRNLTVLELLVNQIGISYSNALTLKEVEKVSAFNTSMVDVQKRALEKALNAEKAANAAKAEAIRNVKLAEEAAKAKSIFLANVSHELRTPLNGVIGNSELLRDSELTKDQAEMADSIRVSADLLLTVINDILDFSKMEADKMELYIVAFKADEMMKEVFRSVSYSNRDKKNLKNVEIQQDINLPQCLIFGDPVRLHQVLGNLVSNSLKFTEKGSITIGAKTDFETDDEVKLTFWVRDTGIGIPPQQLKKLFKPFSQADASTARKYGGSGLGLSICRSLIESMMGGKIELESVEGKGTLAWFTVTFQKAKEAAVGDCQGNSDKTAKLANEADRQRPVTPFKQFQNIPRDQLRICIAEDNPVNQKIAVQFMQKLGFKFVDAYDNGLEAVEGLREKAREGHPYHIILMDVQMPVLDGYGATSLLRKDPIEAVRSILVIAMTASAIQGDREKCLEAGMNDYLAKPVRSNVLRKKLDQYIQQPPIQVQDLQAEARKVAHNVLREMNGSPTPSMSGAATPVLAPTPPSSTPANATPDTQLRSREHTYEIDGSSNAGHGSRFPGSRKSVADTEVSKQDHLHDDDLSPKSMPARMSKASIHENAKDKQQSAKEENDLIMLHPDDAKRHGSVVRVGDAVERKNS